ncbi:ribosomal protein L13 [Babesia caballi]|uniref:Ribosomal protein L13 n=1 Tax=Babesia caballi TaxID=5871 RepID=A0AAV4M0T3_BABCB|nr:ribosomal protein L13 [Babesia caballi]
MEGGAAASAKARKRVTFKLVAASSADPRVADNPWQRTLVLKGSPNAAWKKRDKSTIPKEFLSLINPADFGIHANLSGPQKDALIAEIYGSHEEYERIAAKFADVNAPPKPKEEDLDDDCYFPKDGYDYSQHLAKITPQNFIPAVRAESAGSLAKSRLDSSVDFPGLHDGGTQAPEDQDVAEVLKALDDSASDLEAMDDDFVAKAMDNRDPESFVDENALLWGGYKPLRRVTLEDLNVGASAPVYNRSGDDSEIELGCADDSDDGFGAELGEADARPPQGIADEIDDAHAPGMEPVPSSLMRMIKGGDWGVEVQEKEPMDVLDPDGALSERILQLVEQPDDSDSGESVEFTHSSDESEQWDVETVLTKYTNATNHPQRILTNLVRKAHAAERREPPEAAKAAPDVEYIELPQVVTTRRRGETAEEKRARKAAVRQAKAMITRMKKENKESLKDARKKAAEKTAVGSYDVVNGVKYLRLK